MLSNFSALNSLFDIANVTSCYTLYHLSDKVILFVSDGSPTDEKEEILRVISEQNARLGNYVHIQTFGIGEGKDLGTKIDLRCAIYIDLYRPQTKFGAS